MFYQISFVNKSTERIVDLRVISLSKIATIIEKIENLVESEYRRTKSAFFFLENRKSRRYNESC